MPIYAYRCCRCGQEFEKLVLSASRADEVACPACHSPDLERRPTLFGVAGSGQSPATAGSDCFPAGGGG